MLILLDLAGIAFFFSLVLTPYVRDAAVKFNLVDRPDSARKIHAQPIPRVGGVAIAIAYVLAFGLILVLPYRGLSFNIHTVVPRALGLLPAAGLVFFIGLVDDIRGLKPWQKLIGQVVAALLAFWAGVRIDFLQWHQLHFWISLPVTVLWLIGCANAFNLIDGLDGLAAGVGLFATVTTLLAGLINHNLPLVLVTAPLAGCLLGFLRYNFNPASIFLGDSGSLLIGFLLGCYGAMWSQKSATLIGLTAPMMAMAIPLMDVALSIVRRFLRNQPIFGADRGHIHHRLLEKGLTPRRAALFLYGICRIWFTTAPAAPSWSCSVWSPGSVCSISVIPSSASPADYSFAELSGASWMCNFACRNLSAACPLVPAPNSISKPSPPLPGNWGSAGFASGSPAILSIRFPLFPLPLPGNCASIFPICNT